jgi:ElaB/YqjD/DUF883 family membrane-anchored ribosome-binding protein
MESNYPPGSSEAGMNPTGDADSAKQRAFEDSASSSASGRSAESRSTSLREELANLKSDLDSLMSRASTLTDRELSDARDRLMSRFGTMRQSAKGMAEQANRQLNQGMEATSEYVKDNPLQSVAVAAGVGLLLGALLRRH